MIRRLLLVLLLLVPAAAADTFTETFESFAANDFDRQFKPDQAWYDYSEGVDIGNVSQTGPIIGTQSFRIASANTTDASNKYAIFALEVPAPLTETTFYIKGDSYANTTTGGSRQVIAVESSAPVRSLVKFYVFCNDTASPQGCELRVKWQSIDSTGQVLINASANITQFKIRIVPDWLDGDYNLFVNDVDDGVFPFLEIPDDIGRVKFDQYRSDIPMGLKFDNWNVVGATNGTGGVEGDIATGIKNFASDIRFTTSGSKFFLGFLIFLVLCAAVIVPLLALGLDNTLIPAIGFFAILAALWMVFMEFWPEWVGISMIVIVAALVGTTVRRLFLGITDASTGPGLVAGSLGYFIIASSLLAFSGYAADTITVPTGPAEQQDVNATTNPDQSFIGAVAECVFTGGAFTFGLRGDCSQDTVSKTWTQITDIFGWVRTGLDFLFQLLTFQLPIPVIFNVIIILPPAAALATFAIMVIRGLPS